MRYSIIGYYLILTLLFATTSIAKNFPYRDQYPDVKIIELSELKSRYDSQELVIIDLRSQAEFEAIHISGAIHLPYSDARFVRNLNEVAQEHLGKTIVVYDNGIDCLKSYRAAEEAMNNTTEDIFAYDEGIMAWARAYPTKTLLFGTAIKNPPKQLISTKKFKQKNIDFETFKKEALHDSAVIIDVRDPIQRTQELPGLDKTMLIPVDKLVQNIINQGNMKDKHLLVFDQVGRQVKWLMYHLRKAGYKDFYFLEGGATAVLHEQNYRVSSIQ